MATVEPFAGLATFTVAPNPVDIPQLRTQTLSSGASGLILATQPAWSVVYSLKVCVTPSPTLSTIPPASCPNILGNRGV
nr:Uncharacterised protein [Ipomoea batatas]GMD91122.1 Uncharacterised protein [Ipomoea batatas]